MAAKEYQCEVKSFKMITPTVFELGFETSEPVEFEAGQFFSIVVPGAGPNGRNLRRAYSIASPPEKRPIELCVKLVIGGPGTNFLIKLRPGDRFSAYATYGDFTYEPKPGRAACFIATGTGIAPFRSMIFSTAFREAAPTHSYCLLGVREQEEVIYTEEFGDVPNLTYVPAVSRPNPPGQGPEWTGFRGRVTDWLRQQDQSFPWKETEFYLCGNSAMIDETTALLLERGVEKSSIHKEIYYKTPKEGAAPKKEAAPQH